MACPWFWPVERRPAADPVRAAMLPLGDAWSGLCRAAPQAATAGHPCELGYAGGACPHFPGHGPDAVRFRLTARAADLLQISWVRERDHLPFDLGAAEYSTSGGTFTRAPGDAVVRRQCWAYIRSYLRRTDEDRR